MAPKNGYFREHRKQFWEIHVRKILRKIYGQMQRTGVETETEDVSRNTINSRKCLNTANA